MGQGGFRQALFGVYKAVVGSRRPEKGWEFRRRVFGKPSSETYSFAERKLEGHRRALLGLGGGGGGGRAGGAQSGDEKAGRTQSVPGEPEAAQLKTVYMVGDNPASDIQGANKYKSPSGTCWESILVQTGVYKDGKPDYEPKAIVPDITAAVQWGLKKSGWEEPFP